jgi:hypothetical protein
VGNVDKNESRGSLRFAHIRGVKGPQVFPYFRFDLFVERVLFNGLAHKTPPTIVPFPGDKTEPVEVQSFVLPEDQVAFFHNVLRTNSEHHRHVHVSLISREPRTGVTDLIDVGYVDVLGLAGDMKNGQIHLRNPVSIKRNDRKQVHPLAEGDTVVLRFMGRGLLQGSDVYYRWICRVHRIGLETVTLRPKGSIQQQTGLSVVVRDFCVGGVGIQNSPILESYLMGDDPVPDDPEELLDALTGKGMVMHFYPKLYFPKDVEPYQPKIPAAFSLLGDIVRGFGEKTNTGRLSSLGVTFRHDPVDFDPQTLAVTAWEPLRGLRENAQFKEIHRALNGLMAYLENKQ